MIKFLRLTIVIILLLCINSTLVKSQPIIAANQFIKIIKLVITDRNDIVSQIMLGSKYQVTQDIKEYELDNILYKYDILFESNSGQKWNDKDFYPAVHIGCREIAGYYDEIFVAFNTISSCEILHVQYVELMNFINDYFGVSLKDHPSKVNCYALASMDEVPFPKFINSNIEISACSINQIEPVLETFSVLSFSLKIYKKK